MTPDDAVGRAERVAVALAPPLLPYQVEPFAVHALARIGRPALVVTFVPDMTPSDDRHAYCVGRVIHLHGGTARSGAQESPRQDVSSPGVHTSVGPRE